LSFFYSSFRNEAPSSSIPCWLNRSEGLHRLHNKQQQQSLHYRPTKCANRYCHLRACRRRIPLLLRPMAHRPRSQQDWQNLRLLHARNICLYPRRKLCIKLQKLHIHPSSSILLLGASIMSPMVSNSGATIPITCLGPGTVYYSRRHPLGSRYWASHNQRISSSEHTIRSTRRTKACLYQSVQQLYIFKVFKSLVL
jgi:hypothetical protein